MISHWGVEKFKQCSLKKNKLFFDVDESTASAIPQEFNIDLCTYMILYCSTQGSRCRATFHRGVVLRRARTSLPVAARLHLQLDPASEPGGLAPLVVPTAIVIAAIVPAAIVIAPVVPTAIVPTTIVVATVVIAILTSFCAAAADRGWKRKLD